MSIVVELWTWSLDDADLFDRVEAHLDEEERSRAARFVHERHQRRFAVGRGRLREILAGYLGAEPAALTFTYGDNGKPELFNAGDLRFNLSHTEGLAALGIARGVEIGVDVEGLRPVEKDMPDHYFSAPERTALAHLPEDQWLAGFHRCWTRKEAMVKALGDGLSIPLDSFAVSLAPGEPARLLWRQGDDGAPSRWALAHFDPAPDAVGAVAVESRGARLDLHWRSRA
ncbi:MAG: 4'-phosphopantetheinyl transferase family protein [Phenylobacterium sp.]|uniref:4'-phosphopantetheinyl transferase family protein n=1 Tax=Phenylobacterium sp. TaxID=1871053 RepID=UPI00391A2D72